MRYTPEQFARLADYAFSEDYEGYRPDVCELPNGDGLVDADKRYSHIAEKYDPDVWVYDRYLRPAVAYARGVAAELGVPRSLWPTVEHSTIRVLEYPPHSVGSHWHTDFDLFTLALYRNDPAPFQYDRATLPPHGLIDRYPGIVLGEMLDVVAPVTYAPSRHRVVTSLSPGLTQYSAVFFAIPDHDAPLGESTVGEWLSERLARSRTSTLGGGL